MKQRLAFFVAAGAVAAITALEAFAWIRDDGPIMRCDPALLTRGMTVDAVEQACGTPERKRQEGGDWYPLRGETREGRRRTETTLSYGSIFDRTKNVNLYFTDGELRSVQIFGDYK